MKRRTGVLPKQHARFLSGSFKDDLLFLQHFPLAAELGDAVEAKGGQRQIDQAQQIRAAAPEAEQEQEIRQLRMTVELLRNFLSEAGRR